MNSSPASTPPQRHLSIQVNLGGLLGGLLTRLQGTLNLVAIALSSFEKRTDAVPALQHSGIVTTYNDRLHWDREAADKRFKTWTLRNGFRDAMESTSHFLEQLNKVMTVWGLVIRQSSGERMTLGLYIGSMKESLRKFHRLGLPDKLDQLISRGIVIGDPDRKVLLSLNAARNCLVHREGIVTEKDFTNDDALMVKWEMFEMFFLAEGGGERELVLGEPISGPGTICGRRKHCETRFELGASVEFDIDQFSHQLWSFYMIGARLIEAVQIFGQKHGFVGTSLEPLDNTEPPPKDF